MCTVTFVPMGAMAVLTSSRDEHASRMPAEPPRLQRWGSSEVVAPTDAQKGGTWIAVKNTGDAMVLLNGGQQPHTAGKTYRQSRGLVFMDIFKTDDPVLTFETINLDDIEPFTLIVYCALRLFECRWDGVLRRVAECNANAAHIWSSVTLYDSNAREKRLSWFNEFLSRHPQPSPSNCFQFHQLGGKGDAADGIFMQRPSGHRTVSITSAVVGSNNATMRYWSSNFQWFAAKSLTISTALFDLPQGVANQAAQLS
ncbi:MAG: hypothetical protein EAY75_10630 [Bacteroidetes bacterium]|nr:MAG: hypothetical protein EAY75_10630 [Bacteroidota bacterium]